jgi:MerR family transcriptional regulator, glutamine synthetase repressor
VGRSKATQRAARPLYTISVASRLCALPVHTLRWLESHEFVHPWRTQGNQRLFSESDIERLLEIRLLLERRVNIAGIRTILTIKRTYRIRRLAL